MAIKKLRNILIGGTVALTFLTGCEGCNDPVGVPKTNNPDDWAETEHLPAFEEARARRYGSQGEPTYNIEQDIVDGEPRWAYHFQKGNQTLETYTVCGSDAKDLIDDHTGPLYDFMKQLDRLDGTDGEITETAARQYRNK